MDAKNYAAQLATLDLSPILRGLQVGGQLDQQKAQQQSLVAEAALHKQQYDAEQAENAGYQASVADLVANPTFDNFAAHTLRYPKQIEASKSAWSAYEPAIQKRNMNFMMSVHGLINAGNVPAALKLAEQRREGLVSDIDGENRRRNPEDTQQTDALISLLSSGDPKQIEAAKGMAFMGIGIAAGPDKLANIVNALGGDAAYTLSPGSKRFDRNNNLLADAPFAPDRFTLGPGETRYEGSPGTPPAPGMAPASVGDMYSRMITAESGGRQFAQGGQPLRS